MKVIEKIEIKSFRSFGNRKKSKTEIAKIEDLNIFSGANDSGKSNILRALNLFFNQKTNLTDFIDFNNDFFKSNIQDKDDVKQELITIRITFWNKKNKGINTKLKDSARLPEKFWVARKWVKTSKYADFYQNDGVPIAFKLEKKKNWESFFEDDKKTLISNIRASLSKQLTDFLNSIQYHYIPAIKDKTYFSHLYGELQQTLLKEEKSEVNKNKIIFEETIQSSTRDLMSEFKSVVNNKNLNIDALFELPDLINLFKTLNVQTGDVTLQYRGDGIQAKLIPEILNFIALKELQIKISRLKKGEKAKKYFIWGFEEPENSYEYKNAQLLADRFLNIFAQNAQIFITTHSKEFLSIKQKRTAAELEIINDKKLSKGKKQTALEKLNFKDISAKVSIYRVWKSVDTKNSSQVTRFDEKSNTWEQICDDLGVINEARVIEELQEKLTMQTEKIKASKLSEEKQEKVKTSLMLKIKECVDNLKSAEEEIEEHTKPLIFFEDKYFQIYKIAYLKINQIDCDENNFERIFRENSPFIFHAKNGSKELNKFLDSPNITEWNDKKLLGIFDFDTAFNQFNGLHKKRWKDFEGDASTGVFRRREDHDKFYAMLLPVPSHRSLYASLESQGNSALEIELLFEDETLENLGVLGEESIAGVSEKRKKFNGKKSTFWEKLFDVPTEEFKHFRPLFCKINRLFDMNDDENTSNGFEFDFSNIAEKLL